MEKENKKDIKQEEDKAKEANKANKEHETKHHEESFKEQAEKNAALAEEYKDKWYRVTAEYDNYRKRTQTERATAYLDGQTDAIKKILVIGDNLERGLAFDLDEKTKQGLQLIFRQYNEVIKNLGLEEINPVGEKFDPNFAEAVMQEEAKDGEEEGTVKTVFRKGYKLKDKVVRYAQVVVVK